MAEHPELMQRPVVVRGERAVLAPPGRARRSSCSTDAPVAVIDIGTNTTRLLVAEVEDGEVVELERRTTSRASARASTPPGGSRDEAMDRVAEAIAVYREVIDRLGAERGRRASPRAPCATPRTGPSSATT